MSAPVRGDRALRFTSRATKRIWRLVAVWIALTPLLAWFALAGTGLGTVAGVTIVAGVLAIPALGPQLYVYLRIRGLRLAGDRLVHGRTFCDLTTSWEINLEVREGRSVQRLILCANDVRAQLGTSNVPSYFEPDDLRRLAGVLARSTHPGPRDVAEHLTRLANDPGRESWPPLRPR
ncbi:MAG TPA: hypothetical protein VGP26_07155 [Actinophytocola sp.]|nr:hypothetical protein [Actinophytocola sp.]